MGASILTDGSISFVNILLVPAEEKFILSLAERNSVSIIGMWFLCSTVSFGCVRNYSEVNILN
ncbi:hypothetical protein CJ739_798 [Mariniflexile rhizosphaerae]|nr:hypothetical protein CJ739_798 [Mariniflexile sp. TRM1-10]